MASGKIFGSSGQVETLAKTIQLCMMAIEETNAKGKSMVSQIEGSTSDKVYQQAEEIVEYVARAVQIGQEPLGSVTASLNQYAALLASHGK